MDVKELSRFQDKQVYKNIMKHARSTVDQYSQHCQSSQQDKETRQTQVFQRYRYLCQSRGDMCYHPSVLAQHMLVRLDVNAHVWL